MAEAPAVLVERKAEPPMAEDLWVQQEAAALVTVLAEEHLEPRPALHNSYKTSRLVRRVDRRKSKKCLPVLPDLQLIPAQVPAYRLVGLGVLGKGWGAAAGVGVVQPDALGAPSPRVA
jgi:hypothetical protein